eukprot:gene12290-12426_t
MKGTGHVYLDLSDGADQPLVRFATSATYLGDPKAAGNLKRFLPKLAHLDKLLPAQQARLIALLREPVSRVISELNMECQSRRRFPAVRQALAAGPTNYTAQLTKLMSTDAERLLRYSASTLTKEMRVVRNCYETHQASKAPLYKHMDTCILNNTGDIFRSDAHVYQGLYGVHLQRWFDAMGPEQMLLWALNMMDTQKTTSVQQDIACWVQIEHDKLEDGF